MKFPRCARLYFLLLTSLVAAQSPRPPITHEALWLMPRVGAPVPSPDGRWAVVPVTQPAYNPREQSSDLWLVAIDGAVEPRRITHSRAPESGAAWSPDARRVAFSSRRDGDEVAQIYVLDLQQGGEAEALTSLSTGARAPRWSPDGGRLLFVSDVYPGAVDDAANRRAAQAAKERKPSARVYDGFPIRHWDRWLDERRAYVFVQEARAGAVAKDLLAGSEWARRPGAGGQLTNSGEELGAVWAPDGSSILFLGTLNRDRAAFEDVRTHLFQVSAAGGEPVRLSDDAENYSTLDFRPDGRALLVTYTRGGEGKTYHHTRLASWPWPWTGGGRVELSAALDLSVAGFAAAADSRTIYFTVEDGHRVTLRSVPAAGGTIASHGVAPGGVLGNLAGGGTALVATHESAGQPPEVVRIDPAGGRLRALTRFAAERAAKLELPELEHFTSASPSRAWPIHNLLVRPAGFDPAKKYPLFVVIHGGPAPQFKDQWVLRWNYHLLAAPGYVVLLTNYSGSSGYTEAFGQAVQGDPLKGPADEINAAADEAIRRFPFIDATRQAAGGASYGGHLSNWLQATTTRYRCLVSHAGLVNLESQWAASDTIYGREINNGGPIWEQGPIWREQNPVRLAGNHAKRTGWVTDGGRAGLPGAGEQCLRILGLPAASAGAVTAADVSR